MSVVQNSFRFNFLSTEGQAFKSALEEEYKIAIENLVNPGHSEAEYHQWRGRVSLINKLLSMGNPSKVFTE